MLVDPAIFIGALVSSMAALGGAVKWFSIFVSAQLDRQREHDLQMAARFDQIVDKFNASFSGLHDALSDLKQSAQCRHQPR